MALKSEIIKTAYSHLIISGLTSDPTPEENLFALEMLEDMAREFDSRNICTGYNFNDEPDGCDESGVERQFLNAFKTNLAIRLISAFGKDIPPVLMAQANQSLSNMSARTAKVRQIQHPNRQPRGSGSTLRYNRWRRFFRDPAEAPQSCATNNLQVGEVNDYVEHYDVYLNKYEYIDSYTIEEDPGLMVEESSTDGTDISYRVKAVSTSESVSTFQALQITVTTTDGRVEKRQINFNVTD